MGFFKDIASSGLISSAANVAGGFLAAQSADKARDDIRDASQEAVRRGEAGAARGIDAIREGVATQEAFLRPTVTTAVPGVTDAAERLAIEDLTRTGRQNLAAAGLRGAGRSGVGLIQDDLRRLKIQQDEADEARLNAVRETLGSIRAGEGRDIANIEIGEAARSGEALQRGATAAAPFGVSAGATRGQAIIDASTSALSQLGALAAEEEKREANRAFSGARI